MTDQVFIVSTGSYSDWSIYGVYSTRERAEAVRQRLVDICTYDVNDVEEHDLDSETPPSGLQMFAARSRHMSIEVDDVHLGHRLEDVEVSRPSMRRSLYNEETYLTVTVEAEDREHATKIAADKFREYVALHGWAEDKAEVER